MNPEKVGQFIKDIRKKNNLTQKDLADKYNVTYQAVSKWENGKNLPDIMLIKQMSKDFNIDINDLLEGEYKKNNHKLKLIIAIIIIMLLLSTLIITLTNNKSSNDFNSKTISSMCSDFKVNGMISYNSNKSSIFISNINYNGCEDETTYEKIDCDLLEDNHLIKSCETKNNIKLKDFLNGLTFYIDNYEQMCKDYDEHGIKLNIKATVKDNKVTTYEIPLAVDSNCN